MHYFAKQSVPQQQTVDCLMLGIFTDTGLSSAAKAIDEVTQGQLHKLVQQGDLREEVGNTLLVPTTTPLVASRLLLINCGKEKEFNEHHFNKAINKAVTVLRNTAIRTAVCYLTDLPINNHDLYWKISRSMRLVEDTLYVFDQFKSKKEKIHLQEITFNVTKADDQTHADQAIRHTQATVDGMKLVKDLGNLPSNVCTPAYLAEQALKLGKEFSSLKVTVLEEKELQQLKTGCLLAVAKGSQESPKLITLEYQGADKNQKPVVLVGKGVTFDSGGLSLKTPAGMEEMKYDMCGAATVLGTLKAVATLRLPINVVGVIAAVENMPSGKANKPGDVVTSLSGQTVEIINTDAEGRLILADALTYSERFHPAAVIDIATLTGAVIIALGNVASGLMGNHEPLLQALQQAGIATCDRVWPLPLWQEYEELIDSNVADMANLNQARPDAKSIAAGCFLGRFAKNFHWAHLDVAGTAWKSGKDKCATGRPVPLLVRFLLDLEKNKKI